MRSGSSRAAEVERLARLADRLDTIFRIPGTRIRFGWDGIASIIPVVGDLAAFAPAAWIIWRAHQMGAPPHVIGRMGVNVGLDTVIGSIPIIGTLFDVGWKANRRNVALLKDHFGEALEADRAETAIDVTPGAPAARR